MLRALWLRFWHDDQGAILSTEWLMISSIVVFGLAAGFKAVRDSLNAGLQHMADGITGLSQSFELHNQSFSATSGTSTLATSALPGPGAQRWMVPANELPPQQPPVQVYPYWDGRNYWQMPTPRPPEPPSQPLENRVAFDPH